MRAHDIHLGVTGLSRSGKTVFLTALIHQLEQLGSAGLDEFVDKPLAFRPAKLCWSANGTEFPYDRHKTNLRSNSPVWPEPTEQEYVATLEMLCDGPTRFGLGSPRLLRLHLHDYPGEYLLDVEMVPKKFTFTKWADTALTRMGKQAPAASASYLKAVESAFGDGAQQPSQRFQALRSAYGRYLVAARELGMEMLQPGMTFAVREAEETENLSERALPFVPLPKEYSNKDPHFFRQVAKAYDDYRWKKVKPFVRRLRRIDRQLVLVDVLRVLRMGLDCFNDTKECLKAVIEAYDYSRRWYLRPLALLPSRVRPRNGIQRVVFAATKADNALASHRTNLEKLLQDLVRQAVSRIPVKREHFYYEWMAAMRATQDAHGEYLEKPQEVLVGRLKCGASDGEVRSWNPGIVPSKWPNPKPDGSQPWVMDDKRYQFLEFAPQRLPERPDVLWPNLNHGRVIWRLFDE